MNSEWQAWTLLLQLARAELDGGAWERAVVPDVERRDEARHALLTHGTLRLPQEMARRWIGSLLTAVERAAQGTGVAWPHDLARTVAPIALLQGAIRMDGAAIGQVADGAGADTDALAAVAHVAAMPVLAACRRRLADEIPEHWSAGSCPVCGAWPTLAEMRGLTRERRLRCGRCGGDWMRSVLHCPFCDERDHHALSSLLLEGREQTCRVDVCSTCHGYIKTFMTLGAVPHPDLWMRDVETVELDLAAIERGFARPAAPERQLELHVEGEGTLRSLLGRARSLGERSVM